MTRQEHVNKIMTDLEARGLQIGGIITVNSSTGKLQFIMYDGEALVSSISEPEKAITIYGKDSAETRAMHEIITLSGIKPKADVMTTGTVTV